MLWHSIKDMVMSRFDEMKVDRKGSVKNDLCAAFVVVFRGSLWVV